MQARRYDNMCAEEHPTYKAINFGVNGLSNAELLSLIINRGASTEDSISQARQLLNTNNGSIRALAKRRIEELEVIRGIGDCKAVAVMAALELGRRYMAEQASECTDLSSAQAIFNYVRPRIAGLDHEEAWLMLMNNNYKLIKLLRISIGGITETAIDVRIVIREAVTHNATVVVLCHNHPSNSIRPSSADDAITKKVKHACDLMRIYLLDHLIITDEQYYSYREVGRI